LFTLRRIFAKTISFMGGYNLYPFILGQGSFQSRSTSGVDVADTMCYEVMLASKPAHERRSVASKLFVRASSGHRTSALSKRKTSPRRLAGPMMTLARSTSQRSDDALAADLSSRCVEAMRQAESGREFLALARHGHCSGCLNWCCKVLPWRRMGITAIFY
jgi:hypothetical protein